MINYYNISHFRSKRDLSRNALNELCGYSSANKLWRIENNKIPLKFDDCILISEKLNISSRWLIDSPYTLTAQSILDILSSIARYSGLNIKSDGTVTFPSRYSVFLISLYKKMQELSEDDFFDYYVNLSKPVSILSENISITDKIYTYAEERNISDFTLGVAFGFDEFYAKDWSIQVKFHERELSNENIKNFLKTYQLSGSFLMDHFVINSVDSFEHALLSMYESFVGSFIINSDGSIKFKDKTINNFLINASSNNSVPPYILE